MDEQIIELVRKILNEAIMDSNGEAYFAFCTAAEIFEFAVAGDYQALVDYYALPREEEE